MPRVYTSANDPLDFCDECFPNERRATERFGNVGDGPDGRGNCFEYEADHPPYDHDGYKCCECGKELADDTDY